MSGDSGEGDKGKDIISKSPLPLSVSTVVPGTGPGAMCPERALLQVMEGESNILFPQREDVKHVTLVYSTVNVSILSMTAATCYSVLGL